jgi:flagellar biosynthesis chaperone FliJ
VSWRTDAKTEAGENGGFAKSRLDCPNPGRSIRGENNYMRVNTRALLSATAIMLVLVIPSAAWAQHKHSPSGQKKPGMAGMKAEMSKMMKSPHHMLMKAHLKTMAEFAMTLRDQAVKPAALDVDFARAAVAELRHNLDAIESLRQKHMQAMSTEMKAKMEAMSAEMKSKMQMMMEKMDKDRARLKDQVSALETDVQAGTPDSEQVTAHTNALLKQLGMMLKMDGGSKAGKKKMEMKKKPEMKM